MFVSQSDKKEFRIMIGLGLLAVLRRSVCLAQNSSRIRVTQTLQVYRCQPYNKKFEQDSTESSEKKPRPKTVPVPKITLLLPDNSMTVTVLAEAERLAKRRKLTLVKVEDLNSKTERPVYKLMSSSSLIEETAESVDDIKDKSKENKENFKDLKVLQLSAKIAEHDVRIKAKNMVKWLSKRHQVKVIINLDDTVENKTQSIIEEMMRDKGKIQQIPSKKNFISFLISPLLDKNEDDSVCNKDKTDV